MKFIRSIFLFSFTVAVCLTAIPTRKVHAMTHDGDTLSLPALEIFIEQIKNGQPDELRGVYIPDILAAPIVQQPSGVDNFVSPWQNIVTQFDLASRLGSTGLLAHNYLAGKTFATLTQGQEFYLVYGDGQTSSYVVSETLQYRALEPDDPSSAFMDMKNGSILTGPDLFTKIYNRPGQVIFQTCIYTDDSSTWGRLFIIAEPSIK